LAELVKVAQDNIEAHKNVGAENEFSKLKNQ